MADYNSSLPIRTESAGDAIVKIADATTPAQQLAIDAGGRITSKISDGTDALEINNDGSINAVVTATDLDIRDLAFATDKVDVSGSSVTVTATDLDIRDLSASQDNVAISDGTDTLAINNDGSINAVVTATDLDIRDLAFATDKVDVSGSSVTVSATDLDIRNLSASQDNVAISDGTDTLAVNPDGSINVVVSGSAGTTVNDFSQGTAIAAGASSNHDYTVTAGKTLRLDQAWASASGKMKVEVQIETGVGTNVFNTRFVGFNSTANPNIPFDFDAPPNVAAGVRVRVIRTNNDNQAQNLYSTISGIEV